MKDSSKNPLLNNPHFIEGMHKGNTIVKHIDFTVYKTLEVALEAKKNYGKELNVQLGFDENNSPVYIQNLGIIHVLEQEISKKEEDGKS